MFLFPVKKIGFAHETFRELTMKIRLGCDLKNSGMIIEFREDFIRGIVYALIYIYTCVCMYIYIYIYTYLLIASPSLLDIVSQRELQTHDA